MKLQDWMKHLEGISVGPADSIQSAAEKRSTHKVKSPADLAKEKRMASIRIRDITLRAAAKAKQPGTTRVAEVMTSLVTRDGQVR